MTRATTPAFASGSFQEGFRKAGDSIGVLYRALSKDATHEVRRQAAEELKRLEMFIHLLADHKLIIACDAFHEHVEYVIRNELRAELLRREVE